MELSPKISAQVGLFVMTAACMLLFGWSWLKGLSIMHPPQRFIAQFHDVAGLNNNAPVNINGVRIGQVEQIDLKGKGQVLVHLKISSEDITIPKGSAITIQTQGLVGAKYIEITLPETKQGESPTAIEPGAIVMGQDPVRLELIANKIATKLNHLVTDVGGDDVGISLAEALRHSGETVHNINEAAKKLNSNMDTLKTASENFSTTSTKVGQVADSYRNVSAGANTFFTKSSRTAESINVLAGNLTTTSKRLNKVLENPGFSGELKETAQLARQTADSIGTTMHELSGTLKDQGLRTDVLNMLTKVNDSTERIAKSIDSVKTISEDKELRSDVKVAITNLKEAMTKLDGLVSEPGFKDDIRSTITKVRSAADEVDVAAAHFNEVIEGPRPLWKMMFGPGLKKQSAKDAAKGEKTNKKGLKIQKEKAEVGVAGNDAANSMAH